jgi:D-tyrosyl-tRNA(Tyr) deacylase
MLVLVGAEKGDDAVRAAEAARKIAGLRIFEDEQGRMNRSLADVGGSILAVSQFTLLADLSRGRRTGFERALPGSEAQPVYEAFVLALRGAGITVETGEFGAFMEVDLVNSGPATFVVEVPG